MESYDLRTNQWIEEKVDDAFENVHSMFSIWKAHNARYRLLNNKMIENKKTVTFVWI